VISLVDAAAAALQVLPRCPVSVIASVVYAFHRSGGEVTVLAIDCGSEVLAVARVAALYTPVLWRQAQRRCGGSRDQPGGPLRRPRVYVPIATRLELRSRIP